MVNPGDFSQFLGYTLPLLRGMSSAEGRYNLYSQGSTGWSTLRNEEFQEQDVWGIIKGSKELKKSNSDSYRESPSTVLRRLPTATRMILKSNNSNSSGKIIQHSAPVNIPDWSKIYGNNSKKASDTASWLHDNDDRDHDSSDGMMINSWDSDEEVEVDCSMVPPHEWIARKLARTRISFSVCEGVGRTLKGRDLSNVRNAVLTKTGFLE